jgi:serine/threonine protein kinase/Tol biopolymer transport system component
VLFSTRDLDCGEAELMAIRLGKWGDNIFPDRCRMTLISGARLGPYEILSPVGAGGMGEIYRARDTRLDRSVALKILSAGLGHDADYRSRFEREAKAIARLTHPHICTLHDVGHENGIDFLVMEYLEGETLAQRLERGLLPVPEALGYAVEILEALEQAHSQGILHCDLKPSNVFLTQSGTKLLDFGIAKIRRREPATEPGNREHPTETLSLIEEDVLLGTVHYMAPERIDGQPASASADLFAFGAVLYEMLTGGKAFDGHDRGGILTAILTKEPIAASQVRPGVSSAIDRLLARCLAKDANRRWQSAHDLRLELQSIAEHDDVTASPSSDSIRPTVRRAGMVAGTAALIGIVAIVVARSFATPAGDLKPVQFAVSPPQGTAFRDGGGILNVSPDGRSIVFVAGADGQTLLWLRPLDSTAARPLAGTDGAINPFWSPDSRFVAFFAKGKLKKIDVAGGVPETLCDGDERGGTWNREGVILFTSDYGLFRVGAGGGPATRVTRPDATRQEYGHAWPQFLPDGNRYLYRVKSTNAEYTGIYLGSLDGGQPPVWLVGVDSNPVYAPGYVLFGREGRVFAQAFDTRRARLVGEPLPIADHVVHNQITGRWTLAASETVLAYRTLEPRQLMWVDRQGRALGRVGPVGEYRNPAISSTGDRVAVGRLDPRTDTEDIWVIEAAHGTASRLTFDPAEDIEPVWSPDGREIVFASNRSGHWAIYKKPSDGSGAEAQLVSDGLPMDWSRDGHWLLFRNGQPTSTTNPLTLWILQLDHDRRLIPLMRTVPVEANQGHCRTRGT